MVFTYIFSLRFYILRNIICLLREFMVRLVNFNAKYNYFCVLQFLYQEDIKVVGIFKIFYINL